jgi:hypothetical protein
MKKKHLFNYGPKIATSSYKRCIQQILRNTDKLSRTELPSLTSHFLSGLDDLLRARIGLASAGRLLRLSSGRRLARYRRGGASHSLDCLGGGMAILS